MPHSETSPDDTLANTLPFPPTTATHILNCSYHSWYPRLKARSPKARFIQLSQPFLDYLRSDGIVLPPETRHDGDSGYSDDEDDISEPWSQVHQQVFDTITELGGKVLPKLNWSSPKDATWISPTNDMECRTPNEVYMLLKSSDFITHDLEHPFDDCTIDLDTPAEIPYHIGLRKSFNLNPSLEFRVFVRDRRVIAISQREMNHFPFLWDLRFRFRDLIVDATPTEAEFPDPNFVFDVYIPPPHNKVWIIDINPWAPRTDPLLFSWLELLTMDVPSPPAPIKHEDDDRRITDVRQPEQVEAEEVVLLPPFQPEFRLVQRDDPEAYQFAATKYSAHKLPKDVVDASLTPERMKEMLEEWRKAQDGQVWSDDDGSDDD